MINNNPVIHNHQDETRAVITATANNTPRMIVKKDTTARNAI